MRKFFFAILLCIFTSHVRADAATIRVPADYPTIEQAILASQNGDTVLVAPGTYIEEFSFQGKAITVTSEAGPQQTIIDGGGLFSSVVSFRSGEGRSSVLSGFTIRGGGTRRQSFIDEGGIYIDSSSPTIVGNIIKDNESRVSGGGIGVLGICSPLIQNNIISHNRNYSLEIFRGGGGMGVYRGASPVILDNTISDNEGDFWGGGVSFFQVGDVVLRNNTIIRNKSPEGGGVFLYSCTSAFIVQNLIADNNFGLELGTGLFLRNDFTPTARVTVLNNTIANHDSFRSGIFMLNPRATYKIMNNLIVAKPGQFGIVCAGAVMGLLPEMFRSNNVFNPQGPAYFGTFPDQTGMNGNISVDPRFVNAASGDYHLQQGSPSIDAGDNSTDGLPETDLDHNPRIVDGNLDGMAIIDQGVYEITQLFDICIQDDSNINKIQINSLTGMYQFSTCYGFMFGGSGPLTRRGSTLTLLHNASDRRVTVQIDSSAKRATASVQILSQGKSFTIIDRNITNNTCACPMQ